MLEVDEEGYRIERRAADYDTAEFLTRMEAVEAPALSYVSRYFREAD